MKKLISKFSDKLLSTEILKTVKGGTSYCNCGTGPVIAPSGCSCHNFCYTGCGQSGGGFNPTWYDGDNPWDGTSQ